MLTNLLDKPSCPEGDHDGDDGVSQPRPRRGDDDSHGSEPVYIHAHLTPRRPRRITAAAGRFRMPPVFPCCSGPQVSGHTAVRRTAVLRPYSRRLLDHDLDDEPPLAEVTEQRRLLGWRPCLRRVANVAIIACGVARQRP
jgi:hypothetical protein